MRIRVSQPGIYGIDGPIPVGTELTVAEDPAAWRGRYEVVSGGKDDAAKTPVTNPAKYEAKHKGGGSYVILDVNGKEVGEKLSKEDAEQFNAMSDADKAEFVKGG